MMPALRARRVLWLVLALTLPLPFWSLQLGFAPPVRMFFVGSLVLGFFVSAPESMSGLLLGLFMLQGAAWLAATYWIARLVLRWLGDGEQVDARRLYAVLGLIAVVALLPVYWLPLSSGASPTNWFGLFR